MGRLSRCTLSGVMRVSLLLLSTLLAVSTPVLANSTTASTSPTNSGVSDFDDCATLFNLDKFDEAVVACDRAIALNPKNAAAYFIKGAALFGNAKIGSDGKLEVPAGMVNALNRSIKLAPSGRNAQAAHQILDSLK